MIKLLAHLEPGRIARRARRRQKGQALIIFGLMFVFLIGLVGLATDGAVGYAYSVSLERAASAAALAGAPYMPGQLATATARALAETKLNGWTNGVGTTVVTVAPGGDRQLDVKITTKVPTFFMAALGIQPYTVAREAVAGYLPPIPLGQPGNQLGSTTSQIGGVNQFYILRFKGNNRIRGEGDPYTPQNFEQNGAGGVSTDIHNISTTQGNEVAALDCAGATGLQLPCQGGQNFRVVIPEGTRGEIQVYNAAFAPDFQSSPAFNNNCENLKGLPTCGTYTTREGTDDGMGGNDMANDVSGAALTAAHCGRRYGAANFCDTAAAGPVKRRDLYNAVGYTVMAVPNIFVRGDDVPIVQTKISPLDANNWDGSEGTKGGGQNAVPSYVNVKDAGGYDITQAYGVAGCAICPSNAKFYHSWDNILTENGVGSADSNGVNPVSQNKTVNYNTYVDASGTVGPGTYRVRVDSLNWDGSFASPEGDASKAYAIRVTTQGALPNQASNTVQCIGTALDKCTVSGWEDMTVYSPINSPGGTIPLFQLDKGYAGQIIDIDVYDVGDAGGLVDLQIIDPLGGGGAGAMAQSGLGSVAGPLGTPIKIFNLGANRLGPVIQHQGDQPNDGDLPTLFAADQQINHAPYASDQAGEEPTHAGGVRHLNGTWVRFEIPISSSYNATAYWSLNYLTNSANDTFSFAVSTKGGPLHLVKS